MLAEPQAVSSHLSETNTVLESKPSTQDGIVVNENWKITPKKINKVRS